MGVATAAHIHPVRVLNGNREGTLADVIAGLNYIALRGVSPAVAIMSLGSSFSRSLNKAAEAVFQQGVLVVTSAGNEGKDACSKSPASSPFVLSVGAINQTDHVIERSNYGSCVNMYAPGQDIPVPAMNNYENILLSGTSASAPFVAGVAALTIQAFPSIPTQARFDLLTSSYTSSIACECVPNRLLYTNRL